MVAAPMSAVATQLKNGGAFRLSQYTIEGPLLDGAERAFDRSRSDAIVFLSRVGLGAVG
jgi:hypothetical protein